MDRAVARPALTRGGWRKRLTALVVSVLCGCAALQGYDLALSTARGSDSNKEKLVNGAAGEAARNWLGIPGLGRSAFDLPLAQIASIDPEVGKQREAELNTVLAARPLSSQAWLSLAVFRLVAREQLANVVAALRLSWVTGPNESSVLWQRGVFGLALWDFLSADAREWTTRDLARAMREDLVADRQAMAVAGMLGAQSADARTQIRALLERQGLRPADLARIGLPAE